MRQTHRCEADMKIDKLKIKRISEAKKLNARVAKTSLARRTTRQLTTDEKGHQIYARTKEDLDLEDSLDEGKGHKTSDFVRRCVTAITERPKDLARVEAGKPDGSPFAICNAKYNDNKRSLAAKHSKGEHHSDAQYKKTLATLRESVTEARQQNEDRGDLFYSDVVTPVTSTNRHLVHYTPRG